MLLAPLIAVGFDVSVGNQSKLQPIIELTTEGANGELVLKSELEEGLEFQPQPTKNLSPSL